MKLAHMPWTVHAATGLWLVTVALAALVAAYVALPLCPTTSSQAIALVVFAMAYQSARERFIRWCVRELFEQWKREEAADDAARKDEGGR